MKTKKKLTQAQMRVLIAQDAIKQIEHKRFLPTKGIVFEVISAVIPNSGRCCIENWGRGNLLDMYDSSSAQSYLNKIKRCVVCAKGALLVSAIERFNKAEVSELYTSSEDIESGMLSDFFPAKMLHEMEYLFEARPFYWHNLSKEEREYLNAMACALHKDARKRLVQILEILIENKGEKVFLNSLNT